MWIAGLVLLAAAAVCGWLAHRTNAQIRQMITTETMTVQELTTLQQAATEAAGPGFFSQTCEIVGTAQPGPDGLLTADLSDTTCVWHRHVVTRRYWDTEQRRDSDGDYHTRRVERDERVAERESESPFLVRDATGAIAVHPAGSMDDMEQVMERFEPVDEQNDRLELSLGKFNLSLPSNRREGTIGYRYEEWVLRPDRSLYVLGEAADATGQLAVAKPQLISTKDEQTLVTGNERKRRMLLIGAGAAAVIGLALLVVGLVR